MKKKKVWKQFFEHRIEKIKKEDKYRILRIFDSFQPGYLIRGDRRYLNLCANDYLGLASDRHTKEEAKILADILPVGSGASRLVTGNLAIHQELEKVLAAWKGTESALVFPSGYQTNVGILSALVGKGDVIFADKLNHASLIDGCLLSGAAFHRYRHGDMDDLQSLLKSKRGRKKIIVSDGVFSMDGDLAPLEELSHLARKYGALLIIDDAHGTGVLGEEGAGIFSHCQLPWDETIILMGTLSKAIGCQGGFICCSKKIVDYMINCCRSFIYSTGLSPWQAAMAHYNISRIRSDSHLLEQLRSNTTSMRKALRRAGIPHQDDPTPIIPIVLGESKEALDCAEKLMDNNIIATAIRPPTVAEGTARIRLSLCSAHKQEDYQGAIDVLENVVHFKD